MTDIIAELKAVVGEANVLTGKEALDWPSIWETRQPCRARAVVKPGSTAEVAAVLKLCHAQVQTVVPFGGLTNLVQACATTPDDIALSFMRMKQIEETDAAAQTMTAQAGVTMQQAQAAADAAGLFFPIDIGASDTCEVGGFVSTNAGGSKVIRYGMTRDAVLGLEAVLADGTVISSMNRYIKNNTGFDLKQLFIGTEGVLGVITRVVFRLAVKPVSRSVALVACDDFPTVLNVLQRSRQLIGNSLAGFEVMWDTFYQKVTQPIGKHSSPFGQSYPVYAIIESMGSNPSLDDGLFLSALEVLFDEKLVADAVIAKSDNECDALWAIRDEVEWLVKAAQNFDVSLRSSDVVQYISDINRQIRADFPNAEVATFGHLGDNNLHISVLVNSDSADASERVERSIYKCLAPYKGAISAEHGIGLEKKDYLSISRSKDEIELMRTLKATLDPRSILNPGKVIDSA